MDQVKLSIIQSALLALENLQALNAKDLELINTIEDPALLQTCAIQLYKLAKPLEAYRSYDIVGTYTAIGLISGIKKDKQLKTITSYSISNRNGTQWMTPEEFKDAIKNHRCIDSIGG